MKKQLLLCALGLLLAFGPAPALAQTAPVETAPDPNETAPPAPPPPNVDRGSDEPEVVYVPTVPVD